MAKKGKADKRLLEAREAVNKAYSNIKNQSNNSKGSDPVLVKKEIIKKDSITGYTFASNNFTYRDLNTGKIRMFRKGQLILIYGQRLVGTRDGRIGYINCSPDKVDKKILSLY